MTITIEIKNMPVEDWKIYVQNHYKILRELGYEIPFDKPVENKIEVDFKSVDLLNPEHVIVWTEFIAGMLSMKLNTDYYKISNQ